MIRIILIEVIIIIIGGITGYFLDVSGKWTGAYNFWWLGAVTGAMAMLPLVFYIIN